MKYSHHIWFTADPHFGHKKIHQFIPGRPGNDTAHHDYLLIRNWNKQVKPEDTVIVLGDMFFMGANNSKEILSKLNGTKIRVRGNHDSPSHLQAMSHGFAMSVDSLEMDIAGQKVLMSHYPYKLDFWQNMDRILHFRKQQRYADRRLKNEGDWLLHGHTHSSEILKNKMIHVGLDAWNYRPVHISKIAYIIQTGRVPKPNR